MSKKRLLTDPMNSMIEGLNKDFKPADWITEDSEKIRKV